MGSPRETRARRPPASSTKREGLPDPGAGPVRRRIRVVVATGPGAGARLATRLAGFESIEVVDVAFGAAGAFGIINAARPDVVVVDLASGQALELIVQLRERRPGVHVVAHVAVASERLAEAALAAGAEVCAVESVSDAQLLEALDLLAWHLQSEEAPGEAARTGRGPAVAGAGDASETELREELRRTEQNHTALLEALEEGVITVAFDGAVTSANASAARILGLSREDLVNRNILDPTWVALREDGSFWPTEERPMPVALRTGQAQRGAVYGVRREDGSVRWLSVNAVPLTQADPSVMNALVVSLVDVTERLAADEAARRHATQFRGIFERAGTGMAASWDQDGRLEWVNPALCELTGYTADELVGMRFVELTHPEDVGQVQGLYRQLLRGDRERYQLEKRYIRKDGRVIWVRVTVSLVPDTPDGRPVAVSMVEDITPAKEADELRERAAAQLRRANEELRAADDLKDSLLGVTSHEMRTPLVGVLGYAETLQVHWDALTEAERRGSVDAILRQTRLLAAIVDDLVVFANAQGGRLLVQLAPVELAPLLEQAAEDRGVPAASVTFRCPAGTTVVADPRHVRHMIGNCLA
ncbi:MAG TPA: PAS domain S-box protein, partial [Acidimicrobiales bacterium]|nr:PAS domain S-box protein [Acidimicrobiales bacterium]